MTFSYRRPDSLSDLTHWAEAQRNLTEAQGISGLLGEESSIILKSLFCSNLGTMTSKSTRVIGALILLVLGFGTLFLPQAIAQTFPSPSANATSSYAEGPTPIGLSPAFWLVYLSISPARCSLNSGVCTIAVANLGTNSSTDLVLLGPNGCQMNVISGEDNGVTTVASVNGTAGGQILDGI